MLINFVGLIDHGDQKKLDVAMVVHGDYVIFK